MGEHARAGCYTVIPTADHYSAFVSASLLGARVMTKKRFRESGGRVLVFGPDRKLHSWADLKPGRLEWNRA